MQLIGRIKNAHRKKYNKCDSYILQINATTLPKKTKKKKTSTVIVTWKAAPREVKPLPTVVPKPVDTAPEKCIRTFRRQTFFQRQTCFVQIYSGVLSCS